MDLPPATILLIVFIAAVANLLVLLAVFARARAGRANHLAEVEGFMSSSFGNERSNDDQTPTSVDGWLPTSDGWPPTRRPTWTDVDDWPMPGGTAAGSRVAPNQADDPVGPTVEPFQYPAPNPLEQRSMSLDEAEDEAWAAAEAELEAALQEDDDDAEGAGADDSGPRVAMADGGGYLEDADDVAAAVMDVADGPLVAADGSSEAEMDDMDEEAGSTMDAQAAEANGDALDTDIGPTGDEPADAMHETAPSTSLATSRGRDPLTGMLDAVAFEEVMAQEEAREQRYGHPATVIVFELDGLTKLVDRLGPEPGDRIETALGDTIKRLARRADHVARLERGRYAVLLPVTDEVAAINYVERIRRACELWLESGAIAMRLAIGWASTSGDAGLSGAVRVATDRMRQELRRNARQTGDETPGVESLGAESSNGYQTVEAGAEA